VKQSSPHTPGPWTVDGAEIVDPHGATLATVYCPQPSGGRAQFLNPIEKPHANAQLMAAAPELLDALRYWVEHVGTAFHPPCEGLKGWQGKASAAIEKAEK